MKLCSLKFIWLSLGIVLFNAQTAIAEEEGEEAPVKATYYDMTPAFVANYGTSTNKLKFVKADITLRIFGPEGVSAVQTHEPVLRHHLVLLLSRQTDEMMASTSGQETIRLAALEEVQNALKEATGESHVDDLLFTNFVVQR